MARSPFCLSNRWTGPSLSATINHRRLDLKRIIYGRRRTAVLDQLLDPIRDCLTKDVAAKIAALRADARTQARLNQFAEKNKEGTLSANERSQYEAMVQAGAMIAVLQAKARSVLIIKGTEMDKATRDRIRLRAGNRCEYCRTPQDLEPFFTYQLEHIIAKQHGGTDDESNRALACPWCNQHKGPNIAGLDPLDGALTPCSIHASTSGRNTSCSPGRRSSA